MYLPIYFIVKKNLSILLDCDLYILFHLEKSIDPECKQKTNDDCKKKETVVIFVTKEYEEKVNGEGPKGSIDNCYLEFHHIVRQMTLSKILAVAMDGDMRDPQK